MDEDKTITTTEQEQPPIQEAPTPDAEAQEAQGIIQDAAVAPAPAQITKPKAPADPESYVRFSKPHSFDGKNYAGIDLKGIESLSAKDLCEAEKYLNRMGIISPLPEMAMEYVGFIANRASGQPIEFFMGLPPKDAVKVKNKVTSFFYGED